MTLCILTFLLFYISTQCFAQLEPTKVDIPLSDGKFLAGDLYLPNETDTFPTILIMTPYGKFFFALNGLPLGIGENISESSYAFLVVDWRCRFASLSACATNSDNGEDGYDVVEWIATQPWSDGKVGMWGPSALGNIQFQTARNQPPHLVCCVPEVTAPHTSYQRYFPGGALTVERLETLNILFPGSFNLVLANPFYNLLWTIAENNTMYPDEIEVPMLLIGGWYDINISQTIYLSDTLASSSPAGASHKTLIGPWVHGGNGQAVVGSINQGELFYPEAEKANTMAALDFFDFYLRGIENGWPERPRYTYFQMGDNSWETSAGWPPEGGTEMTFYLQENLGLSPALPASTTANLSFLYNPEDPSPTQGGKTLNLSQLQGPYDQSELVESRNDLLSFTTPILEQNLAVAGKIRINLFVSSNRPDTDFVVRLTEVYPDGRSILLSDQVQRMRFRNGYRESDVSFMKEGNVYEVPLVLEDIATTFKAGNRLRLLVSSSNYPRYNRNMNTGEEMYPDNQMDTLINPLVATNTLFLNANQPSSITLPLSSNMSVSVTDDLISPIIHIEPNPATTKLSINSQQSMKSISLYTLTGQEVLRNDTDGFEAELEVGKLIRGIYWVRVFLNDRQFYTQKVIISH